MSGSEYSINVSVSSGDVYEQLRRMIPELPAVGVMGMTLRLRPREPATITLHIMAAIAGSPEVKRYTLHECRGNQ